MASFRNYKKQDGTLVVYAQIRIKKAGKVVFSESNSFEGRSAKKQAELWAGNREAEIKNQLKNGRLISSITVAEGMEKYVAENENTPAGLGKTKKGTMLLMSKESLLDVPLASLTSAQILAYLRKRVDDGAMPATIASDFAYIRVLAKYARVAWSIPVDLQEVEDAGNMAEKMGYIGRSNARNRRPLVNEIAAICAYKHREANGKGRGISTPMRTPLDDIVLFAIFSSRRLGEIVRIQWEDVDFEAGTVVVRDMKHPRKKKGNNMTLHLPIRAISVLRRQPKVEGEPRIFPYAEKTIGTAFQRACHENRIEDLHFHDLRHEGVSHLFELHYDIPQVAMVSGHKSWSNLARYTHLMKLEKHDKYKGFELVQDLGEPGLITPT